MVAVCREHDVKLAVGCTRRWDAYWNAARDLIEAGGIGRVLQVNGYGRAALEAAIGLRESHRHGNSRLNLPLADRTLGIHSAETLSGDLPVALRRLQ